MVPNGDAFDGHADTDRGRRRQAVSLTMGMPRRQHSTERSHDDLGIDIG
jgi:hypothetical protein